MGGKNHFELIFSDYELIFSEDLPSQKAEKDIPMQHQVPAPGVPKLLNLVKGISNFQHQADQDPVMEEPPQEPKLLGLVKGTSNFLQVQRQTNPPKKVATDGFIAPGFP